MFHSIALYILFPEIVGIIYLISNNIPSNSSVGVPKLTYILHYCIVNSDSTHVLNLVDYLTESCLYHILIPTNHFFLHQYILALDHRKGF